MTAGVLCADCEAEARRVAGTAAEVTLCASCMVKAQDAASAGLGRFPFSLPSAEADDPDAWIVEGAPLRGLGTEEAALLGRSTWDRLALGDRVFRVLCPASTTFDAAEALRLQLVDRAPSGVTVDVEIAASEPGTLSPEDEAGVVLFGELRRERVARPC